MSKIATEANLKDFATGFSDSTSYDRTRAHSWLSNLTRRGLIPEAVAENIKAILNTDEKAGVLMQWHGTTDFAAVIEKETAPLGIFKAMEEEKVIRDALSRVTSLAAQG